MSTEDQIDNFVVTSHLKKGFWFKIVAEVDFKPRTYSSISLLRADPTLSERVPSFEDLKFTSNKDIGPKDFFEMACNNMKDILDL